MHRFLKQKKAQSTLEYAVLIAVCVGALLAMNAYTKRAMQGRVRSAIDDIGGQYSAGNITSKYQITHELTETKERFGTNADFSSDTGQGVSYYEVITPGRVTRETIEDERITKDFSEETLFP